MKILKLVSGYVCTLMLLTACLATEASAVTVAGIIVPPPEVPCRGMASLWEVTGPDISQPERLSHTPDRARELQPDCSFEIRTKPGRYFLRATIRRTPGDALGPLRTGDLIFLSPDSNGKLLDIDLSANSPIHIGTHDSFLEFRGHSKEVANGVQGRLIDEQGLPVEGLTVQVYGTADMQGRPLAFSQASDSDGVFHLHLAAGSYYLLARDNHNLGIPRPNPNKESFFGIFGDKTAEKIELGPGEFIPNIEILIKRQVGKKKN